MLLLTVSFATPNGGIACMFCRSVQELTLLALVDHPNIVRVIDVLLPATSTKAEARIVMECAGVPLDFSIGQRRPWGMFSGLG